MLYEFKAPFCEEIDAGGGAANADVSNVSTSETVAESNNGTEVTETQVFAKRLKESTQKAVDAEYEKLYGTEYGIKSKADYDAYMAKQEAEAQREQFKQQNGFDPDTVKPLFEQWKKNDPDFQELSQIRKEKTVNKHLTDLNNELKENGVDLQLKDLSDEEIKKIPNVDKVTEYVKKGHSLADAFWLANKKEILSKEKTTAEQEAIKKIASNGASSPGSLSAGGEEQTYYTQEQVDKMSAADVKKNYKAVMASMKKWKG